MQELILEEKTTLSPVMKEIFKCNKSYRGSVVHCTGES